MKYKEIRLDLFIFIPILLVSNTWSAFAQDTTTDEAREVKEEEDKLLDPGRFNEAIGKYKYI